ncbi:MAG: UDP-N-acetylmuramoyl-L-alanyl-D-glutamate--2,6-diaminopimelate ligase [Bacilli bacterium]|nr:UDP-N-acetylmuramoyl-L-alanyl-D-glutamate--2,6-diaminopimelate ligase [Bacilli bacterium]
MLNIKTNSKKVKKGDTFVAIKGQNFDGHDYIDDAIKNGADTIICEKGNYSVKTVIVENTKVFLKEYLYTNYYENIKDIKLIGITGTNGKTTSCYLLYQALNKLNLKTAYIGTIGFYIEDKIIELERTTPELIDIYDMLLECKEKNIEYVVMEVSSHALELERVDTLNFNYGIFTNLTRDHLDFHESFENYAKAKSKLFKKIKKDGYGIINIDDKNYKNIINVDTNNIYYGFKNSDFKIINYKYDSFKMFFNVSINRQKYEFETNLLGKYNIYNLMSVIIVLNKLGIHIEKIKNIVKNLEYPKGRMDTIKFNKSLIIVDYAHTPDAVFNVISCVKEYTKGKIYSIIGCGGNRDKTKRKMMSFYSTILSDYVIMTSDNPRNEDPLSIICDMTDNLVKNNYEVIIDRKEAIEKGMDLLKENDVLLILGKGHENYQIIGDKKYYHDDKKCVLEYIDRVS